MSRKPLNIRKGTKTVVKLETMNIPIKRRQHGSSGSVNKRIKLQDGEKELTVDPTVDKVLCKSCKPAKYFKDVDSLRYHLVCSHDVPESSSYYCDPSLSPSKPRLQTSVKTESRKIRVKSQSIISEIQDLVETSDLRVSPSELDISDHVNVTDNKSNSDTSIAGKFREALTVRRMNGKRSAGNCRDTKPQPTCLSEKKEVVRVVMNGDKELKDEALRDRQNQSLPLFVPNRRQPKRLSQGPYEKEDRIQSTQSKPLKEISLKSTSNDNCLKGDPILAPAPVKSVSRVKSSKKTQEVTTGRRVSERIFEGDKPYKCNHCQLSYSSLENKKLHEQTHSEKSLLCHVCDMRFFFPLCLKKHRRIHQN